MPIKAVIFDLDGTLLDSTSVWRHIDESFLGKRGYAVPDDYFPAVATMNLLQAAEYTVRRFALPESTGAVIAEWHEMAHHAYAETIPLKPGASAFLRDMSENGFKIALATASDPDYYIPALRRCGVYDFFDLFVHSRPGLYKGSAAVYLYCAEKLGVRPEECVVFEDIYDGILAAKQAGMTAVAIADPQSIARRNELASMADIYIASFEELLGTGKLAFS